MYKKITYIVIGLLIAILLAIVIAIFVIAPQKDQAPTDALRDLLSFGGNSPSEVTPPAGQETDAEGGSGEEVTGGEVSSQSDFTQISSVPVVSGSFFTSEDGVVVRYIEQTSGNIFEFNVETKQKTRITNTTILGIKEALWVDESTVILRYTDEEEVRTLLATIKAPEEGGLGELSGEFLEENILSLTLSPDKDSLFYITNFGTQSLGTILDLETLGKEQVWNHSIKEWSALWGGGDVVSLITKPSSASLGYSLTLNTKTERTAPLLNGIRGLLINPSPSGDLVLHTDNSLRLSVYDNELESSLVLPLSTSPEKCVWGEDEITIYCAVPETLPENVSIDNWYKGLLSFSDNIWKISTLSGAVSFITSPQEEVRSSIDVTNINTSPDEDLLLFTNKNNGSLWLYTLSQ